MSDDSELEQLRQQVRQLTDRHEIWECINTQARGHDRHDLALMESVYHPDGIDEHGPTVNSASEYGLWANKVHGAAFQTHTHNLTTHTCEIDGDAAHAETYVIVQGTSGKYVTLLGGRYIDRLERRDGKWAITLRRCTVEWTLVGDGSTLTSGSFAGFIKGTWTTEDVSYQRPLTLDGPQVIRW